jgi:hypothetical protein
VGGEKKFLVDYEGIYQRLVEEFIKGKVLIGEIPEIKVKAAEGIDMHAMSEIDNFLKSDRVNRVYKVA